MNSISQVVKNVSFFYCSSKSLIIDSHIGASVYHMWCAFITTHYVSCQQKPTLNLFSIWSDHTLLKTC